MPDATVDINRIAELRGWTNTSVPPSLVGLWGNHPDSGLFLPVPDWEHDGNAMLELLNEMWGSIESVGPISPPEWRVYMTKGSGLKGQRFAGPLPAAVAAAWVAWKESQ